MAQKRERKTDNSKTVRYYIESG